MALALGAGSVEKMMTEMSYEEYATWKKLDGLEPLGLKRADFQAGVIASTIRNVNLSRGSTAKSPHDFMPLQRRLKQMKTELDNKTVDDQVRAVFGAMMKKGQQNGGLKSR